MNPPTQLFFGDRLFNAEESGEDFAGIAFDYLSEGVGVEWGLGADVDGAGSILFCPVDEAGGGVDGAGGTDDEHQRGFVDLFADAVHLVGNFTEEDDVGAEAASAGAAAYLGEARVEGVVWNGRRAAVALAVCLVKFAMHVEKAVGAGALVEVVDVLCAEEEAVADSLLEFGEGVVGGVGLGFGSVGAAFGIELPDEFGIASPGIGCADVFNAIAGPEAVVGAEGGQAALGADAGAGEDEYAVGGGDGDLTHDRSRCSCGTGFMLSHSCAKNAHEWGTELYS
jgi:hypothetical protein